jgi:alpha-galactosidase
MLDPNAAATLTLGQIHDMVDDLIEAHGETIPEAIRRGSTARRLAFLPDLRLRRW